METQHTEKQQARAEIFSNVRVQGDYFRVDFTVYELPALAKPGQFVHLQIPGMEGHLLRRPFSIFDTDPSGNRLSLLYKVVGEGSRHLSELPRGTVLDMLGPLGNGFSPLPDSNALLIAGGYGCAALFGLAKQAPDNQKPTVLLGGRTKQDLLLVQEYASLGCKVLLSTDDGSCGTKGRVTALLQEVLAKRPVSWIAACGPLPMLHALGDQMQEAKIPGELSLDSAMCCGVGACFGCVTKIKDTTAPDGWSYRRICHDGPVFAADQIVW